MLPPCTPNDAANARERIARSAEGAGDVQNHVVFGVGPEAVAAVARECRFGDRTRVSVVPPSHQVLVVDDDNDIRDAMTAVLEVEGFSVAPSRGVEDAYAQMRSGFRPCVVLLDLHMPRLSGWGFLDRMAAEPHLHDVPVVVVSGDLDQREASTRAGHEFLRKPVPVRMLIAVIGKHCRRHARSGTGADE